MENHYQLGKKAIKNPKRWIFILSCVAIAGLIGLVLSLCFDFKMIPVINDSVYFVLLFNSIGLIMGIKSRQKLSEYFFSWNDKELKYCLPGDKNATIISFLDIKSVTITSDVATVTLKSGESKQLNLNVFYHPQRGQIIDFLKTLAVNSISM